jgi:hypothetical protein
MKFETVKHKDFTITKRIDAKSHCASIYGKNGELVKMVAGDIKTDGSENAIEKAKQWVDENN